jgi:predicted helicase
LNLMGQTVHAWAKWTNWGERFRYLCVCSDPTVTEKADQIVIRPEDADFPVRTDPAIVGRFLDDGDDAVSVVFCTYQSAPVVGEAMTGRPAFDLGIFDEAHKTTGREGTRFAFALKNENLPIRKRLFLTATHATTISASAIERVISRSLRWMTKRSMAELRIALPSPGGSAEDHRSVQGHYLGRG